MGFNIESLDGTQRATLNLKRGSKTRLKNHEWDVKKDRKMRNSQIKLK